MAWDVTVADTHAESHRSATTLTAGAAADKAAANKEMKYSALYSQHSHLLSCCHRDFRCDESADSNAYCVLLKATIRCPAQRNSYVA